MPWTIFAVGLFILIFSRVERRNLVPIPKFPLPGDFRTKKVRQGTTTRKGRRPLLPSGPGGVDQPFIRGP